MKPAFKYEVLLLAEDDQTSTKVSSAAGDDAALAPDETAPVEEGTPQEEVKDEAQGETEEEDAVEPSQDVPVKSTKDVAKEKEDQKSEVGAFVDLFFVNNMKMPLPWQCYRSFVMS